MVPQMKENLVQLESFEEVMTLVAALTIAALTYKFFGNSFSSPVLASLLVGSLGAIGVAYLTWSELTLQDGVVTHRNRVRVQSFPLSYVDKVGVRTFWQGLPGQLFMFILHRPPAEINGYSARVGLFAWPSASGWPTL